MPGPAAPVHKHLVRYFVSYTRDDSKLPDKLLIELRKKLGACRDYEFVPWRDTDILVGTDWHASIQTALKECDFGLLLVSPAFLGKRYITEKELPHFVGGDKPCVPVTLSRIDFEEMDLKGLEPMQFFGLVGKNDMHPRSFEECGSGQQKSAFAHQLYLKIKARLDDLFASDSAPRVGLLDEAAYRTHIRRQYRLLDIEAIGGEAVYRDVELQAIFIPQHARDCGEWLPEKLESPGALTLELAELHEHKRFHQAAPRPILDLLADSSIRCRVVLGAPGAGKTSLTRIRVLDWEKNPLPHALPLLIELRRFHKSAAADFPDYLVTDKDLLFRFAAEALRARLAAQPSVEVIFDGLDEIFEPEPRERIALQIAAFAAQFPEARILVTSRLIGYPGRILRDAGFAHWLLADFDDAQVAAFIEHWTEGAITHASDRIIVRERLDAALKSPALRELAGNPLLLTLMAVLARESDLPRDVGQLYKHSADLLLRQWDARRYLVNHLKIESVTIDHKDKHDLLRNLAWEMQTGQHGLKGNLIPEKKVRAAIDTMLASRIPDPGARRAATDALIDQLTSRNYILCHVGGAQFAFVHRGFLEFFASEYLLHILSTRPATAEQEITEIYRAHGDDDAWREVLILAATRFDSAVADKILLPLAQGGERDEVEEAVQNLRPNHFRLVCAVLGRARDAAKLVDCSRQVRSFFDRHVVGDAEGREGLIKLLVETLADEATRLKLLAIARGAKPTLARLQAVDSLVAAFPDDQETRDLLFDFSQRTEYSSAVDRSVAGLARLLAPSELRDFLINLAIRGPGARGSMQAVTELAERFGDAQTRAILEELARREENTVARGQAVTELAEHFGDAQTRALLEELTRREEVTMARRQAVVSLAEHFRDAQTRALLEELARREENTDARSQAVTGLAEHFGDAQTRALLEELARREENTDARSQAVTGLAEHFGDAQTRALLEELARREENTDARSQAVTGLAEHFGDAQTRVLLEELARREENTDARSRAVVSLAEHFRDAQTRALLEELARREENTDARSQAARSLAELFGDT